MRVTCLLSTVAVLGLVGVSHAALIDVDLLESPDIASGFIATTYDSGTGDFEANGFALSLFDTAPPSQDITDGSFLIEANIDQFTGEAIGGSLAVGGLVGGFGPDLLQADLVDFGFLDGGGQIFDFLFTVTGGELADLFGGVGASVGVIMDANGNYSGDWMQSFTIGGIGVADLAPVPGPASLALLGLAGLTAGRRRRA